MPKSKKKKNKDFQKVKLKVGKSLPKGDNVTNLSFKTRKIQLTQRIKDGEDQDLVTRNKLSVQDLLRQCEHHNSTSRVNAVAGLKELWLANHRELMHPAHRYGYGAILQRITTMFIDDFSVVRHSVIGLFKAILHKLSCQSKTAPRGFPILHIHTYLCCAMAHMHEDIKLDALVLFDTLMESFPSLLVQHTGDLLNSLLSFISSQSSIGAKAGFITQKLTLNPDSKLPIMKFRQRVLSRIKHIFQIACDEMLHKDTVSSSVEPSPESLKSVDGNNTFKRPCDTFVCKDGGSRFQSLFSGATNEETGSITSSSNLELFIKHSVPILLQCWKEARASVDSHQVSSSVISRDSSEVMSLVVTIIQLAFNLCSAHQSQSNGLGESSLVPSSTLVETHAMEFERCFMWDFPYSLQVEVAASSRKRKSDHVVKAPPPSPQFSLDDLNLRLCDIMSRLSSCPTFVRKARWLSAIERQLKKLMKRKINSKEAEMIISSMQSLFASSSLPLDCPSAYTAVKLFSSSTPHKRLFFKLCAHIVYKWKKQDLPGADSPDHIVNQIYRQLPDVLHSVLKTNSSHDWTMDILDLMIHGHTQRSQAFLTSLTESLDNLLDPKAGIPSCTNEAVVQKFFFMLSLGTPLSKDHYKQIIQTVRRPSADPPIPRRKECSLVSFIMESLAQNIRELVPLKDQVEFDEMTTVQQKYFSEFLSFMVSLQVGFQKEELNTLCPVQDDCPQYRPLQIEFDLQGDQWDRHVEISSCVNNELCNMSIPAWKERGYSEPFTLTSSKEHLWINATANRPLLHVTTVHSLLQMVSQAVGPTARERFTERFYKYLSRVLASLLLPLCSPGREPPVSAEKAWQLKDLVAKSLSQDRDFYCLVEQSLADWATDPSASYKDQISSAKFFMSSCRNTSSVNSTQ